jgi:hypothetical protein
MVGPIAMVQGMERAAREALGRLVSSHYPILDLYYCLFSASVNVRLWELGEYQGQETTLPHLIDPGWIKGYLARTTVSIGQDRLKVWATVDLAKVRRSIIPDDVCANVYCVYSDL